MFTGIVADRGCVAEVERGAGTSRMWITADVLSSAEPGSSVAVDGVCLTVTERRGATCAFDVHGETLDRSVLGRRDVGSSVNVELPVRVGDELGGHLVQGHVDGVGHVVRVVDDGGGRRVDIVVPHGLGRFLVEKGSVTVNGVSLTITVAEESTFSVALVPHTLAVSTLGELEVDDDVNVEVDVIAKYVLRLLEPWSQSHEGTLEDRRRIDQEYP